MKKMRSSRKRTNYDDDDDGNFTIKPGLPVWLCVSITIYIYTSIWDGVGIGWLDSQTKKIFKTILKMT